jgi:hypothetical protein
MSFNPLQERGIPLDKQLRSWQELNVAPYDKNEVHPYTQCRVIAMNGVEVEAVLYSHQFARHMEDLDVKRQLAMVRRIEQQQQKSINWLTPADASTLEVTIGYEQVAVDLTAWLAQNEPDAYAKQCYDFGLLEDFDHLYRYANLMDMIEGKKAERIVQDLTEIMPGRPTALEHRHPHDEVRRPLKLREADPRSVLHALTVVAAEQQTMNFYMNIGNRPTEPLARALYLEIALIEEQHVTHYESLLDAGATWAEMLVLHEYNECYLYWSFLQAEVDDKIRKIWELHLAMEIEHLHQACALMRKLDHKDPEELLPKSMPQLVEFKSNKEYVRNVIASEVDLSADLADFVPRTELPDDHRFHAYQASVHGGQPAPSDTVIERRKAASGEDYRVQPGGPHPIEAARSAAE